MSAYQYFRRRIIYAPCPACGNPTAVGFAGEDPVEPTPCTRCRGHNIAIAIAARADTGPCARCRRDCTRYGDHGSPLCVSCRNLSAHQGDGMT